MLDGVRSWCRLSQHVRNEFISCRATAAARSARAPRTHSFFWSSIPCKQKKSNFFCCSDQNACCWHHKQRRRVTFHSPIFIFRISTDRRALNAPTGDILRQLDPSHLLYNIMCIYLKATYFYGSRFGGTFVRFLQRSFWCVTCLWAPAHNVNETPKNANYETYVSC